MENNLKIKEVSEEEQKEQVEKKINALKKEIAKFYHEYVNEKDELKKIAIKNNVNSTKELVNAFKLEIENISYPHWVLIDENAEDEEQVLMNFSTLLDENVYDVEKIANGFYLVHYSDWTSREVMAIVNDEGDVVVESISDYTQINGEDFIIYANGLKYEEHADYRYVAVIDKNGYEIIPPIKEGSIEFIENNNLYHVNNKLLYNMEGEDIGIYEGDLSDNEEDFIIFGLNNKQGLLLNDTIILYPIYDKIIEDLEESEFQVFYIKAKGLTGVVIFDNNKQVFFIEPQFKSLALSEIPYIFIASTASKAKLILTCDLNTATFDCFPFNEIVVINLSLSSGEYVCCGINPGKTTLFYRKSLFTFISSDFSFDIKQLTTDNIDEIKNAIGGLLESRLEIVNRY
jgi:hypothetical protein